MSYFFANIVVVLSILAAPAVADEMTDNAPILGTPFQIQAERLALRIMARPDVKAAAASSRERLLHDPAAASNEGLATLDRAIALWLTDLTLREIAFDASRPNIVLSPAIRPHTWHGYTFPGSGIAGDSPDNIQRTTFLNGKYSYVLTGRVPKNHAAQFTLQISPDFHTAFGVGTGRTALPYNSAFGMLRDVDLDIDKDGRVEITLDSSPANGRRNHFQLPPVPTDIWFRENLSDWRQEPMRWSIRRVDDQPPEAALTEDRIARAVVDGLGGVAAHWARHKETFMGHPAPNTLAGPMYRKGGFGYLSFGFFDLKQDEAIIARIDNAHASYYSLQILDRWYLALDRGPSAISRNNSQTTPNADGSVTYVLSLVDPGAPNWVDVGGLHQGIVLVRQQGLQEGAEPKVLEYRVVKLDQVRSLLPVETPWVTPKGRAEEIARRAAEIDLRYRR